MLEVHYETCDGEPFTRATQFSEIHELIIFDQVNGEVVDKCFDRKIDQHDIIFTPGFRSRSLDISGINTSWFVIKFSSDFLNQEVSHFSSDFFSFSALIQPKEPEKDEIIQLVNWLYRNYKKDPFGKKGVALLNLLLVLVSEKCNSALRQTLTKDGSVQSGSALQPLFRIIRENQIRNLSMADAAALCDLSPTYFSRIFKKSFRCNYSEYIIINKLESAKRLLLYTEKTVTEISSELNFSNPSHFVATFKKYYSATPKEFKIKARQIL